MPNQFFTEGNDIKFIKDILISRNKSNDNDVYVKAEGWTSLHLTKSKFLENTNKGGRNFVFFDGNGNPTKRRSELLEIRQQLGIDFELFLFPNDLDIGAIESLLLQMVLPQYSDIFQCFDNYSQCISNANAAYVLPNFKSKFFAFAETTGQETNLLKINFNDTTYYDLNHASLNSLYTFLDLHL